MLSKAKGRISITAQFSFPPKSNEIFQNCWPAYATVKLSPTQTKHCQTLSVFSHCSHHTPGDREAAAAAGAAQPPAPALLWDRELSPAWSPSLPQGQLSLPFQGSHPQTCCTILGEFAAVCGKDRGSGNRSKTLQAVLHRLPRSPEPRTPTGGEPSGTTTQAGGTEAAAEERQDGWASAASRGSPSSRTQCLGRALVPSVRQKGLFACRQHCSLCLQALSTREVSLRGQRKSWQLVHSSANAGALPWEQQPPSWTGTKVLILPSTTGSSQTL